jgi:hypothetical protein
VLAGPIFNCTDPAALTIATDGITLDLGGHAVVGNAGCLSAIEFPTGRTGARVTNGIVRQCDAGVHVDDGTDNHIDGLLIAQTSADGVWIEGGSGNVVESNRSIANLTGVKLDDGATGNFVRDNSITAGNVGIVGTVSVGTGNTIKGNEVVSNTSNGMTLNGTTHKVIENTVAGNGSVGIFVGGGSTIRGNVVRDNQGAHGIQTSGFNTITENRIAANNGVGLTAGSTNTISANKLISNLGAGMNVGSTNKIKNNVASRNASDGIRANADNTIVKNRAERNGGAGIVNQDGTLTIVKDNRAIRNDGDGIVVVGGTPKINGNAANRNGFPGGVANQDNLGIRASSGASGSGNVAEDNDVLDPAIQCDPPSLC